MRGLFGRKLLKAASQAIHSLEAPSLGAVLGLGVAL